MKTKASLIVCVFLLLAAGIPATADAATGSTATRIRFQTGATSGVASGQLGPRRAHDYVLRASAGQPADCAHREGAGSGDSRSGCQRLGRRAVSA